MPFDITATIVQGIPESLVLVFLVYALLGRKISPSRILALGFIHLSLMVAVRSTGAPFPAHALVSLVVMSVTISVWERVALQKVLLGWGTTIVVLIVLETCFAILIASLLGTSTEELLFHPLLWVLVGLPHIVVMALMAWYVYGRGGVKPFRVDSFDDGQGG